MFPKPSPLISSLTCFDQEIPPGRVAWREMVVLGHYCLKMDILFQNGRTDICDFVIEKIKSERKETHTGK